MATVPPNNPVTPTGSLSPYEDAARIVCTETPVNMPSRDRIHLLEKIHLRVAYLQWLGVFALIYVGYVLGDFWQSRYFQFGVPVVTQNVTIFSQWEYWLKIALFAVDRLVAAAGTHVVGSWREKIVFNEHRPVHEEQSYGLVMFIFVTDHMVNWIRFSVMVVFLYAQIDFALAMAIPDVLIACGTNAWMVMRYDQAHRDRKCPAKKETTTTMAPQSPLKKLDSDTAAFNISPIAMSLLQWVMVLAYALVFYFTDFFASPYFAFTPPFFVFGREFKNWRKLVGFIVFVFGDSMIASTYAAIVGPYIVTYVLNNSSKTARYTTTGARFIYLGKRIFGWVRIVFMLNFTNSKFVFLLAMFLGDFFVTLWMTHRVVAERHGQRADKDRLATMPLSALGVSIAVLFELVIVVIVLFAQLNIHKLPYFDWPPPLVLFETIVSGRATVTFVILYTVFDRVIYTLTTEITAPYIANVVNHCDLDGLRYNVLDLLIITFSNDLTNWIRRIVAFNFQLSNYSLVIFQGVTDVGLSEAIFERYLRHKVVLGEAVQTKHANELRKAAAHFTEELKKGTPIELIKTAPVAAKHTRSDEKKQRSMMMARTITDNFNP